MISRNAESRDAPNGIRLGLERSAEVPVSLRTRLGLLLRRTGTGMRVLQAARIAAAPREFALRKLLSLRLRPDRAPRFAISPRLGYRRIERGELEAVDRLVELSQQLLTRRADLLPRILAERSGKHRIVFDLLSDAEIARDARWIGAALDQNLLESAVEYLGTLPVLSRIGVGFSPGDQPTVEPQHSQLLHVDGEDFRQLKLMVNVSHVERDDGPFSWLSAEASDRVFRQAGRDVVRRVSMQQRGGSTTTPRFTDDDALACVDSNELRTLEGPPGTAVLVDTARCLHFGSRVAAGRQRELCAVLFQRYHRVHDSPSNVFDPSQAGDDEIARRLLTSPREHALGTFYPEPTDSEPAPRFACAPLEARERPRTE